MGPLEGLVGAVRWPVCSVLMVSAVRRRRIGSLDGQGLSLLSRLHMLSFSRWRKGSD